MSFKTDSAARLASPRHRSSIKINSRDLAQKSLSLRHSKPNLHIPSCPALASPNRRHRSRTLPADRNRTKIFRVKLHRPARQIERQRQLRTSRAIDSGNRSFHRHPIRRTQLPVRHRRAPRWRTARTALTRLALTRVVTRRRKCPASLPHALPTSPTRPPPQSPPAPTSPIAHSSSDDRSGRQFLRHRASLLRLSVVQQCVRQIHPITPRLRTPASPPSPQLLQRFACVSADLEYACVNASNVGAIHRIQRRRSLQILPRIANVVLRLGYISQAPASPAQNSGTKSLAPNAIARFISSCACAKSPLRK